MGDTWDRTFAPHTGYGNDYNTSVKFTIQQNRDFGFPSWTGGTPKLSEHDHVNGDNFSLQYHGHAPRRWEIRVDLESETDLDRLAAQAGQTFADLRYVVGLTRTLDGTVEEISGIHYLTLHDVFLASVTDEIVYEDGGCEATLAFIKMYVAPAPTVWPDLPAEAPRPIDLPAILSLVPYKSANAAGTVTPTLTGSARIVETDKVDPEYDTGIPDATNLNGDPYIANSAYWSKYDTVSSTSHEFLADGVRFYKTNPAAAAYTYFDWNRMVHLPAERISVVPGEQYTMTCDMELIGRGGFELYAYFRTEAGASIPSSTRWERLDYPTQEYVSESVEFNFTVPATAAFMAFSFDGYSWDNLAGAWECTVQHLQLTKTAAAVPFVDPRNDPEHSWFLGAINSSPSTRKNVIPETTNLILNPLLAIDTSNWSPGAPAPTLHQREVVPVSAPTQYGMHVTGSGIYVGTQVGYFYVPINIPFCASAFVVGEVGDAVRMVVYDGNVHGVSNHVLTQSDGEWLHCPGMSAIGAASAMLIVDSGGGTQTIDWYVCAPQFTTGQFASLPFINPVSDPLASWDGTPNASTSTRERTPSVPAWEVLEATKNHIRNPVAHADLSNWFINGTSARVTMPGPTADIQTAVYCEDTSGGMYVVPGEDSVGQNVASGQIWTGSMWIYADASMVGRIANLFIIEYGGATGQEATWTPHVMQLGWNYLTHTAPIIRADRVNVGITLDLVARVIGDHYWVTGAQIENKPYATPLTPQLDPDTGTPYTGHAWTGTAYNSASTRTIGRIYTDIPVDLTPVKGAAIISAKWPPTLRDGFSHTLWGIAYDGLNGLSLRNHMVGYSHINWNAGHPVYTDVSSFGGSQDADNITYSAWDGTSLSNRNNDEALSTVNNREDYENPWSPGLPLEIGSSHNNRPLNGLIYHAIFFRRPLFEEELRYLQELIDENRLDWVNFGNTELA